MSDVVPCIKKIHFIGRNWRKEKKSTVACVSSPIKIHYFDYPKHFINRINEVYDFSIKYRKSDIERNINFIYNHLFCCNHTCNCVGMVTVMSASHYVTSASYYQSRSSMYIRGLIPWNGLRQFRLRMAILSAIGSSRCYNKNNK